MPRMSTDSWLADTRASYDTVAASYAVEARAAFDAAPYLRGALTLFAGRVRADGGGPVADVGCGPGHVTAYLHELGVDASVTALLASWSLIHIPDREVPGSSATSGGRCAPAACCCSASTSVRDHG
jgi:2-polyprenyl-3-methyl-5-hydroxy-6-metoxy-1,4-benzoquinol methylase